MTTYQGFTQKLERIMGDTDHFSDDLLYDACLAAHEAILPWAAKRASTTLTGNGSASAFSLPIDVFRVITVYDPDENLFLPQGHLGPLYTRLQEPEIDWIEFPEGKLSFSEVPVSGRELTVYYLANWTIPASKTDTAFVLVTPRAALQGMLYYAASVCYVPEALLTSRTRVRQARVDPGSPEDNPLERTVEHLLKLFHDEMKRLPKMDGMS
jgi:hypothetical protein